MPNVLKIFVVKLNSKVKREKLQKIFEQLFFMLLVNISLIHLLKLIVVKGRFDYQATIPSEGMHKYDIPLDTLICIVPSYACKFLLHEISTFV